MNALYALYREAVTSPSGAGVAAIDWLTDDIKCSLVRASAYTPNLTTDQFLDPAVTTRVADSANFSIKTAVDGTVDAADITFTAVAAGAAIDYIVIWKDTGVPTTSPLLALIDTAGNLPVVPNGGDITVQWDAGADKIFSI